MKQSSRIINMTIKAIIVMSIASVACMGLAACRYGFDELFARKNQVDARSGSLRSVAAPTPAPASNDYTVLLLSDVHFGAGSRHPSIETDGTIDKLKDWAAGLSPTDTPKMIIFLGDNTESGTEAQYQQFKDFADDLASAMGGIPYFCIAGNHDLYNDGWAQYVQYCSPGSSAYYFTFGGFEWYFLDSASGTFGDAQLAHFKKLAKKTPAPKLAFTHYPIYDNGSDFYFSLADPQERNKIIDIFARCNFKYVLEGHQHQGSGYNFGAFRENDVSAFRDFHSWHLLRLDSAQGTAKLESWRVPSKSALPVRFTLHDNASENKKAWPKWIE
ncbi:MAG: metallophosphoesterase [Treponemataceae bacterium]|nr:MAG: metallophosphoesterase [Treponemataceae bacterium]